MAQKPVTELRKALKTCERTQASRRISALIVDGKRCQGAAVCEHCGHTITGECDRVISDGTPGLKIVLDECIEPV